MRKTVSTPAHYARFCKMLCAARLEAGQTQAQLAERLGWKQGDISNVECGVRRLDVIELMAFAKAIGFDVHEFVRQLQAEMSLPASRERTGLSR